MSRPTPIRDLAMATTLLTVVPLPVPPTASPAEKPDAASWFPLVGLAIGSLGWGVARLAAALGVGGARTSLVAVLVVIAWATVTRLLHWDGLADVADAFWGGHTPARRLEIMADSATGAFGATAIVLVALVEVAAVSALLGGGARLALLFAPALARFAATFACWLGAPARPGGLGASVMRRPGALGVVAAAFVGVACGVGAFYAFGLLGLGCAVVAIVAALVVPHLIAGRMGGVTGDVMGASVLLSEAFTLAAFALVVVK